MLLKTSFASVINMSVISIDDKNETKITYYIFNMPKTTWTHGDRMLGTEVAG